MGATGTQGEKTNKIVKNKIRGAAAAAKDSVALR
jgi:hypothetical protein